MPSRKFEGESKNGNLEEALTNAIQLAEEKLKTDFVRWEIEKIHGEAGGIVNARILKVVISVKRNT